MGRREDQKRHVGICYRALSSLVRTFPLYRHRQLSKGRSYSCLGTLNGELIHKEEGTEEGKVLRSPTVKHETQEEKKEALPEEIKSKGESRILRPVKPLIRSLSNINEKSHAYIEDKKRAFASQ